MKNEPIPDFDHLFDTYQRLSDAEQKSPEARLHYGSGARLLFRYRNRRCGKRVQNLNILVCLIGCNMLIQQVIMLCSPSEFISVAEKCGLILPLGKWVLGEACRQMAEWLRDGLDIGQIAVNVSAVEFHGARFLAGVRAILDETGLDPRRLEIEMTESGLMQDSIPSTEILRALKALGVQIAIDDFGTGYSSLSYLRRFPIDTLKIDQSFVKDIDGENEEGPLVSAIIRSPESAAPIEWRLRRNHPTRTSAMEERLDCLLLAERVSRRLSQ